MRGLTISRVLLACGLVLAVVLVWTSASPANLNASTIIGSFEDVSGCNCIGTTADDCGSECGGWALTVCDLGGSGPATCSCATSTSACDELTDAIGVMRHAALDDRTR